MRSVFQCAEDTSDRTTLTCIWACHVHQYLACFSFLEIIELIIPDLNSTPKEQSLFPFVSEPLLALGNDDAHIGGREVLLELPFLELHLPLSLTRQQSGN